MIKLVSAKCPSCGASIEIDPQKTTSVCKFCKSTIFVEGKLNVILRKETPKDEIHEKCLKISEKLNIILELYIGDKDEMLLMLKDKIGLVSSGKTTLKIEMMKKAKDYKEPLLEDPFTYKIGNRVLDHFEYKRDGSIELTYKSHEKGYFSVEYYGKILKYTDLNELIIELDRIIEKIKL